MNIHHRLTPGRAVVLLPVVRLVQHHFVDYLQHVAALLRADKFFLHLRKGKDGFTQGKGERRANFQDREVIAYQSTISLSGLVVGRMRLVDHRCLADPAGQCLCRVGLVVNNLGMIELHARLHHDSNHARHGVVQPQFAKGYAMGVQRLCRIFDTGNMHAVNRAGFSAWYGNFSTNDVG